MTTGKTIALTLWTFVGKAMSLLKMLSRFVIEPRRYKASIKFVAAITICSDLDPKKIKSLTVSVVSPSICHEVMGLDAIIFVY